MISTSYLRKVFKYKNGHLYWRHDPDQRSQWNAKHAGKRAGSVKPRGYSHVCIRPNLKNGLEKPTHFLLHRLIYQYHHGHCPEILDHISGDNSDNRIENLRPANAKQNSANQRVSKNSVTGYKGVGSRKDGGYIVRVSFNGKRHHVGCFKKFEDACEAHEKFSRALQGEWYRSQEAVA